MAQNKHIIVIGIVVVVAEVQSNNTNFKIHSYLAINGASTCLCSPLKCSLW